MFILFITEERKTWKISFFKSVFFEALVFCSYSRHTVVFQHFRVLFFNFLIFLTAQRELWTILKNLPRTIESSAFLRLLVWLFLLFWFPSNPKGTKWFWHCRNNLISRHDSVACWDSFLANRFWTFEGSLSTVFYLS